MPITLVRVETAEFDTQRLKAMLEGKPLPVGTDYQLGEMYDEYNVRQYVLKRDNYTCQCCGAHTTAKKAVKLHVHHLESRKMGGNAPGNLITLCITCHDALHKGKVSLDNKKRGKPMRDAAFMGIMRRTLMSRLREELPITVQGTYGYTLTNNKGGSGTYTGTIPVNVKGDIGEGQSVTVTSTAPIMKCSGSKNVTASFNGTPKKSWSRMETSGQGTTDNYGLSAVLTPGVWEGTATFSCALA